MPTATPKPTPKPTPRQRTGVAKVISTEAPLHVPPLPLLKEQTGVGSVRTYSWGEGNLLPQEMLRVVYDSGAAETCLSILAQFIGGEGFADPVTAKAMANPEQTFNELLAEAKHYAALGFGVAFALRFGFDGLDPHIYVVAAECLRRERDGTGRFVLNEGLNVARFKPSENQIYLPYHPTDRPEALAAEVLASSEAPGGYWGHLLWSFERRVGRTRYPVPHWYAGKEDVESEAALAKYDKKQVTTSFMPDAIITLTGEKYKDIPDEKWEPGEGEDERDRPMLKSPDLVAMEAAINSLRGANSKSSLLVNTVDTPEEAPKIDWVDKGPNSKGLTDMRQRVEGTVYRRFRVPPELCGVAQAGQLGNNQQIVNSIGLFGLVVRPARALITSPLAQLRPDLDFTVKPLNPVDYIDPAVIAKMTPNEVRALRDLPEVDGGDVVPGVGSTETDPKPAAK